SAQVGADARGEGRRKESPSDRQASEIRRGAVQRLAGVRTSDYRHDLGTFLRSRAKLAHHEVTFLNYKLAHRTVALGAPPSSWRGPSGRPSSQSRQDAA